MPSHDAEEFDATLYDELVALTEASWARWLEALARVPPEALTRPGVCGAWSVSDLIGHVAAWDDVAVQKIGALAGTAPPAVDDVDAFNAREAARRKDRAVDEQLAEMHRNHQRLLGALEGASRASDDELQRVRRWIAGDTWEHYEEHAAQVAAAFPSLA